MADDNKTLVEKVDKAFGENDTEGFLALCNDGITWTIVGDQTFVGKDSIRAFLGSAAGMEPPQISITGIVADEDSAAAHGEMTMKNKDGQAENYSYCDVYGFSGGKVDRLTSFIVKIKS